MFRQGDIGAASGYISGLKGTPMTADNAPESPRTVRLKRLKYQAWHRGTKEMDLIFGHFANQEMENLTEEELQQFEALLEVLDTTAYNWICGVEKTPEEFNTPLFKRICSFKQLKGTVLRDDL